MHNKLWYYVDIPITFADVFKNSIRGAPNEVNRPAGMKDYCDKKGNSILRCIFWLDNNERQFLIRWMKCQVFPFKLYLQREELINYEI